MDNFFELNNQKENNIKNYKGKMVFKSQNQNTQKIYDKLLSVFDTNHSGGLEGNELQSIWEQIKKENLNNDKKIDEKEISGFIKKNKALTALGIKTSDIINFLNSINKTIENKIAKEDKKLHFDENEYSLENLKKKYPKCYIQNFDYNGQKCIMLTNENGPFLTVKFHPDGIREIQKNSKGKAVTYKYDKKNNLISEEIRNYSSDINTKYYDNGKVYSQSKNNKIVKSPIAEAINKDICKKNAMIIPTTGKDIEKHIKQVTSGNIIQILKDYKEMYGESLYDAIESEWGLDKEVKKRIMKHLNDCIVKSQDWQANKPNGKIDKNFHQDGIGDCWFVSALSSFATNPKGLIILNDSITQNKDGSFTVKFKGTDKSYTISPFELYSKSYAAGDKDVRILELAAEKHFSCIDGGIRKDALELLSGNDAHDIEPSSELLGQLKKMIKSKNIIVTAGTTKSFESNMNAKESREILATKHAYSIVDIDDNYVYVKDPMQDTNINNNKYDIKRIKTDDFIKYFRSISYVEI